MISSAAILPCIVIRFLIVDDLIVYVTLDISNLDTIDPANWRLESSDWIIDPEAAERGWMDDTSQL